MSNKILWIIIAVVVGLLTYINFFHETDEQQPKRNYPTFQECSDFYTLSERYFGNEEVIRFGVTVVYFQNEADRPFPKELIEQRIKKLSDNFSEAHIGFDLINYRVVSGTPTEVEQIRTLKQDIDRFDIKYWYFYDLFFNNHETLMIYVFSENGITEFGGVAAGAPSTVVAIRDDFFISNDPLTKGFELDYIKTLEHEVGHMFGLLHTHAFDQHPGTDPYTGDKICDTRYHESLLGKVSRVCEYIGNRDPQVSEEELKKLVDNFMSYSMPCRSEFTQDQIRRMRWMVEQSHNLKQTIRNVEINNRILDMYFDSWVPAEEE